MSVRTRLCAVFMNDGGLRSGWKMARDAALYLGVFYGVLFGLAGGFGALFNAWGLTTDNLYRAPVWAQRVVAWHSDFAYAAAYVLSGIAGFLMTQRCVRSRARSLWIGVGAGALIAALLTAVALCLDCMRLEWPLSEPSLSVAQMASAAVLVVGKLSGEILTKRILFERAGRRTVGYALVCAATFLMMRAWTDAAMALNTVLAAVVGCALYERGGLAASAGFPCAMYLWFGLIFAWPGMSISASPLYALYHVSDAWLTGGNMGAMSGWGCAILLMIGAILLLHREIRALCRWKKHMPIGNTQHRK